MLFLPALTAVLLSFSGFSFPFLFDDYDFLDRVQFFRLDRLLPDSQVIFYRPISREIYFGILNWLSPGQSFLGHVFNAILLAGIVYLLGRLTARIAGLRAG